MLVLGLVSDGLGLANEAILALLAADERAALCLELGHRNCRESRGGVVQGGVVVNLVDWDSRVGDVRFNGLCCDVSI